MPEDEEMGEEDIIIYDCTSSPVSEEDTADGEYNELLSIVEIVNF